MNKSTQLDCELNCKATARLDTSVAQDMEKTDASLKELLEDNDEKCEDSAISDS